MAQDYQADSSVGQLLVLDEEPARKAYLGIAA
jgi:hypothetical protein